MALRNILLHVKPAAPGGAYAGLAMTLAAAHGARLSALLTERHAAVLALLQGEVHPSVVKRRAEAAAAAAAAEQVLRAAAGAHGVALDFLTGEGDAAELLGYVGRAHDLVVVEQTNLATDELGFDVPERAIAVCGRPVLVVPNQGSFATAGKRIVIAWNASREAALAVQGAAPFIAAAEEVVVLSGPPRDRLPSVTRVPAFDLATRLGPAQGSARIERLEVADGDAGAAICAAAQRLGADMLVMGAYGRSWFREWVLGGATRHVLTHMTIPVLMAH